jgi:hypothetical protein
MSTPFSINNSSKPKIPKRTSLDKRNFAFVPGLAQVILIFDQKSDHFKVITTFTGYLKRSVAIFNSFVDVKIFFYQNLEYFKMTF